MRFAVYDWAAPRDPHARKHALHQFQTSNRIDNLLTAVCLGPSEILLVSQFTLYARLKKPKPDYSKAMGPTQVRGYG